MRLIFTHDEADIYEGDCASGPAAALRHDLQYWHFTRAAVMWNYYHHWNLKCLEMRLGSPHIRPRCWDSVPVALGPGVETERPSPGRGGPVRCCGVVAVLLTGPGPPQQPGCHVSSSHIVTCDAAGIWEAGPGWDPPATRGQQPGPGARNPRMFRSRCWSHVSSSVELEPSPHVHLEHDMISQP